MATSGRGTGIVGHVQIAVDPEHHLVVAHEVVNEGHDRTQPCHGGRAKQAIGAEEVDEARPIAAGRQRRRGSGPAKARASSAGHAAAHTSGRAKKALQARRLRP